MSIVACRHCCSALGQVLLCCQLILLCLEFAFGLWWERCAPGVTSLLSFRYATVYTMFPVFSLVLDQDVKPEMAMLYPELYKDLTKVRPARPKQGGLQRSARDCACEEGASSCENRGPGSASSSGGAGSRLLELPGFIPRWARGLGSSQATHTRPRDTRAAPLTELLPCLPRGDPYPSRPSSSGF